MNKDETIDLTDKENKNEKGYSGNDDNKVNLIFKILESIVKMTEKVSPKLSKWLYKNRLGISQFIKYGLVGVLNTIIGLGTILILQNVIGINHFLSNIGGYAIGVINSFIWNKLWTFKSKGSVKKEILLFWVVFAIAFSIQFGMLTIMTEIIKLDHTISQIISMAFYTIIGFFGNKFITFR